MNVCIFGASSSNIPECYIEFAEKLGHRLASDGHGMVFGAGRTGLMGAAARGAYSAGGKIIGADYEVDEEWLDRLGGSPVTLEEAKQAVQSKVPASSTENIRMWEESDDGRGRFEGELFHDGIKYEFEIDPATGIIFDWNADLRE